MIADNPSSASRRTPIEVKFHFIRGLIRAGEVSIVHIETERKYADILTR